ncbi:MAG: type II toxin-antitoxin system HicA family toxin [Ignavibacteria bacterium]|nr:type II toxin-antitoxin system HicA family toxin [Ignavibacteria bacterium]
MKRKEFVRYLNSNNCILHRNGSKHDIYKNLISNKKTTIPRHPTIDDMLCREICKQLGIPKIK